MFRITPLRQVFRGRQGVQHAIVRRQTHGSLESEETTSQKVSTLGFNTSTDKKHRPQVRRRLTLASSPQNEADGEGGLEYYRANAL